MLSQQVNEISQEFQVAEEGLKIQWGRPRVGSSPTDRTIDFIENEFLVCCYLCSLTGGAMLRRVLSNATTRQVVGYGRACESIRMFLLAQASIRSDNKTMGVGNETRNQIDEYLGRIRKHLPELRKSYGVRSLALFGSHVRGEARVESDLDVLVTFDRVPGLLRFLELEAALSQITGAKVDLVMERTLRPRIGERVLAEAVSI